MVKIVRYIFLVPLSFLYGLSMEIRNVLFDLKILKSKKIPVKVISVGNLCMGGTGKTPFVIALCNKLRNSYQHILVLSRGYGRHSKGAKIVSIKGCIQSDVWESGDEAMLIALRCPHISVVVAEKRILGWDVVKSYGIDLVILDDAFQHRSIERDLNILLMNGNKSINDDHTFPYGRLREWKHNLRRADMLCITKKDVQFSSKYIRSENIINYLRPKYKFSQDIDVKKSYTLISALANPKEFENSVKQLGVEIITHIIFKDHYRYVKNDIKNLNPKVTLITEKDWVKLCEFSFEPIVIQINYTISAQFLAKIKILQYGRR